MIERRVRAETIADTLAHEILSGDIEIGSKLDENIIAIRFGVSRTPVREALQAVCARGLAIKQPYRGVVVQKLDAERLVEMFVAMAEIEGLVGSLAAVRITPLELEGLKIAIQGLESALKDDDSFAFSEANKTMHRMLYSYCGNAELQTIAEDLRQKVAPYRRIQFTSGARMSESQKEHWEIFHALENKDPELVRSLLKMHLMAASVQIIDKSY